MTEISQIVRAYVKISIHTTRKGLWRAQSAKEGKFIGFQSTQPAKGCDPLANIQIPLQYRFQSTQPAKGCDSMPFTYFHKHTDFNPHNPQRVVTHSRGWGGTPAIFQSTQPAKGCDNCAAEQWSDIGHFNPHNPQRVVTISRSIWLSFLTTISIHTTRKGLWHDRNGLSDACDTISIHTTRKGLWLTVHQIVNYI